MPKFNCNYCNNYVSSTTCFSLVSLCEQFIQLYIVDYHVVERALKERYLIGQSVRAVIFVDIGGMRSEGPTPKVFRCRTYSAPLITNLSNNSPYGLPY